MAEKFGNKDALFQISKDLSAVSSEERKLLKTAIM